MIIKCPICGPREASEFTYIGDATITRPDQDNTNSEEWSEYIFQRENPRGAHEEHWHHTSACRSFLKVKRDTVTHSISRISLEGPWSDYFAEIKL